MDDVPSPDRRIRLLPQPYPMNAARFSIGIDLGTTNSALAYAPLNGDAPPERLPIQQRETLETLVEVPMLPSFIYLPENALAQHLRGKGQGPRRGLSAVLPGAERRKCQAAWCALPSPGCAIIRRTATRRSCPGARKISDRTRRSRRCAPPL